MIEGELGPEDEGRLAEALARLRERVDEAVRPVVERAERLAGSVVVPLPVGLADGPVRGCVNALALEGWFFVPGLRFDELESVAAVEVRPESREVGAWLGSTYPGTVAHVIREVPADYVMLCSRLLEVLGATAETVAHVQPRLERWLDAEWPAPDAA